jgi:SAM-dependent methyltransferase
MAPNPVPPAPPAVADGVDPAASMASPDAQTAAAFATSWNTVGDGSVYSRAQFVDWMAPVDPESFRGQSVLEMGFGNGSLLFHAGAYRPRKLVGIDLGDTLAQTERNLGHLPKGMVELHRGDLTTARLGEHDFVYCIGVLHHLDDPAAGFEAVLRHTRPGGRFHAWVYAAEGNGVVVHVVDPIRRVACRLPWWLTKYGVALPLVVPFYAYAKTLRTLSPDPGAGPLGHVVDAMPLADYSRWIARRAFPFFHHVAFDQLVTPRTHYLSRATVEGFLRHLDVDPATTYVERRNGNSWKFGGQKKRG